MNISATHQRYRNQGSLTYLSQGVGRARILVYDGTRPAAGAAVTTQVLLVTLLLDAVPGTMVGDALHLASSTVGLIMATGQPTWARVENGDGDWAGDLSASAPGAGGEVQLEVNTTTGNLNAGGGSALVSAVLA